MLHCIAPKGTFFVIDGFLVIDDFSEVMLEVLTHVGERLRRFGDLVSEEVRSARKRRRKKIKINVQR